MKYMLNKQNNTYFRIYFVGIGGISMSALAKHCLSLGYSVGGSDVRESAQTEELRRLGAKISIGHAAGQSGDVDVYIVTSAVGEDNEEIKYARAHGIPVCTRTEAWAEAMRSFAHTIGVAGSHGKTTATAMIAHVLLSAKVPFAAHIGGEDLRLGNYYRSGQEYFVTESCEYKRNLLRMIPETAVLLNIDRDHMECYRDESDLVQTFGNFCAGAKRAAVCADDPRAASVPHAVSFGIEKGDYRAVKLRQVRECYRFIVEEGGAPLCAVRLRAVGRHHVYNALAAVAALRGYGFSGEEIGRGLASFVGVRRRFERIGFFQGAEAICDYAHHPREISAVLRCAEKRNKKKPVVVFQPHTYSRTKLLMSEFAEALARYRPIIYRTYAAREEYDAEGSARVLSLHVPGSVYADTERELLLLLRRAVCPDDALLFLGAGDIYEIACRLIKR